tara:strand:+ start:39 stop:464 length:426 start_codon:yes stop_codon:yes gene_type:complete
VVDEQVVTAVLAGRRAAMEDQAAELGLAVATVAVRGLRVKVTQEAILPLAMVMVHQEAAQAAQALIQSMVVAREHLQTVALVWRFLTKVLTPVVGVVHQAQTVSDKTQVRQILLTQVTAEVEVRVRLTAWLADQVSLSSVT